MKGLSQCLIALHTGIPLDDEIVLIPAGGTARLMPLASIMFGVSGVGDQQMLVVLDSDTQGIQAAQRLERELLGDGSRIMLLGQVINQAEATIEDLFPREVYADAVRASSGYTFK